MDNQVLQNLKKKNASLEKKLEAKVTELKRKNRSLEIEAALEKVRVRATDMRVSSELAETSAVLFHQLGELNIKAIRTGVGIFDDANDAMELWLTTISLNQEVIRILDYVNLHVHPVFENIIPARKLQKPYAISILEGDEVRKYYHTMSTYISVPKQKEYNQKEFFYSFFFSEGTINVISEQPLADEECNIMIRFAQVFGLIYTRFLDLQKAEERAKDLAKQGSLDRVRGQIASMRSTADLQRITPLIWNELNTLGVLFIRCGIFIMDENTQKMQAYLSAPDGHSLAVLNLPFDSNELTTNISDHWRKQMVYHKHWNKEEFIAWTKSMMEMGQIQSPETYQDAAAPPETLDLHFVPFTQGMLYVGNSAQLNEDEIDLVKSLAEAFSIAYSRYEDFTKLEKAKESIEVTLTNLRATQKQLIQSEKMASLGELTAGIAHEIQNPLNFVNNFSEVNKELIAEMRTEISKGNYAGANEIAKDVETNEEKINHHGKRAGDIVNGMLQHSRVSTGVKELTNINALADEYLRLAYHGLRAKDKSFNAKMETDFDNTIGKINIIPQDIGRVLLNLFNNAFYAVNEHAKTTSARKSYEPTVSLSTKKSDNHVLITVSDNGNGIPKKIINKIFQPFFTTKPTGQGTGLGLSLSYDIVKAHGGEIKVESKEGDGTEFIVILPVV